LLIYKCKFFLILFIEIKLLSLLRMNYDTLVSLMNNGVNKILGNNDHKAVSEEITPQEASDEYSSTNFKEEGIFQLALESTDESSKAFLDANEEFVRMFGGVPVTGGTYY
jgi:hypothetical protein